MQRFQGSHVPEQQRELRGPTGVQRRGYIYGGDLILIIFNPEERGDELEIADAPLTSIVFILN